MKETISQTARAELRDLNSPTSKTLRKGLGAISISMIALGVARRNPAEIIEGLSVGALTAGQEIAGRRIQHEANAAASTELTEQVPVEAQLAAVHAPEQSTEISNR
jgi:hypothetical protein